MSLYRFVHVAVPSGKGEQLVFGHREIEVHIRIVTDRSERIRKCTRLQPMRRLHR